MSSKLYNFVCINYNTTKEIIKLVESLNIPLDLELHLHIVDNSQNFPTDCLTKYQTVNLKLHYILSPSNLGYFGGFRYAVNQYNLFSTSKYLAIVNPDLIFFNNFFEKLSSLNITQNVGVIAPRICNMPSKSMANPYIIKRPSSLRMLLYLMIHRNIFLLYIYSLLSKIKKYIQFPLFKFSIHESKVNEMYAPHGSLMIFCPSYWFNGGNFNHQGFLFAEEFYIAEICKSINLKVVYFSDLKALHYQHQSVSLLKLSSHSLYAFQSLRFIYNRFFKK